jgi:hypothetical protein
MTQDDTDFETWFSVLQTNVLDNTGVEFNDEDAVRGDFEAGRSVYDVIDEITAEYGNSD